VIDLACWRVYSYNFATHALLRLLIISVISSGTVVPRGVVTRE